MNAIDFCFWLQGFFEIAGGDVHKLSERQTASIQNHLSLVFKHEIDPLRDGETPATPNELDAAHAGKPPVGWPLIRC